MPQILIERFTSIESFMRIWLHVLKKSVMENFIFCVVKFMLRLLIVRTAPPPQSPHPPSDQILKKGGGAWQDLNF